VAAAPVEEPVAAAPVEEPVAAAPVEEPSALAEVPVEEPTSAPVPEVNEESTPTEVPAPNVAAPILEAVNDIEKECSISSKVISDAVVGQGDFEATVNGEKVADGHDENLNVGPSAELVANGHSTGDAWSFDHFFFRFRSFFTPSLGVCM